MKHTAHPEILKKVIDNRDEEINHLYGLLHEQLEPEELIELQAQLIGVLNSRQSSE